MSKYLEADKEEIQTIIDALRELNNNIEPVNAGLTTTADAIAKIAQSSIKVEKTRKEAANTEKAEAQAQIAKAKAASAEKDANNKSLITESKARQSAQQEQLKQLQIEEKQLRIAEKKQKITENTTQGAKVAKQQTAIQAKAAQNVERSSVAQIFANSDKATQKAIMRQRRQYEKIIQRMVGKGASVEQAEKYAAKKSTKLSGTAYKELVEQERERKKEQEAAKTKIDEESKAAQNVKIFGATLAVAKAALNSVIKSLKEASAAAHKYASQWGLTGTASTGTAWSSAAGIASLNAILEETYKKADAMSSAMEGDVSTTLSKLWHDIRTDNKELRAVAEQIATNQQRAMILQAAQSGISTDTGSSMAQMAEKLAYSWLASGSMAGATREEIIASDLFTDLSSAFMSAILGDAAIAGTSYTSQGWEGWAYQNLDWNPNVDYSDEAKADARARYLWAQLKAGSDEERAELIKNSKNQSRLIKSIAGQLFSFDEVESQQAISMEDTVDAVNYFGEEATNTLRNEENWLEAMAKKYGLSAEQIANIRRILTDTDMTMDNIELLLAAGIKFDDTSTASIIEMATSFGLSAKEIVASYKLYDNDLSKAAEELRKMAEQGIDVHVYLHDKEDDLQADYDTTAATEVPSATGSSHKHETGRGSGNENYYENLLEEMTDEELKERDPAGWERKHAFESLTDGGTHPAGKEFPSFYSPTFATGGIGTSKITDATLFENGPEAVIPLTTDIGKQFMADAIQTAIGDTNIGGDTINVKIDGPVFTESERQLNKWATEFGDRYAQIKARRGGK